LFEESLENLKLVRGITLDTELSAEDLQQLVETYKNIIISELDKPFPQNPKEQLWDAIAAVFGSWMNQRAITYRRLHDIPASWGTAVNIQGMVFGNMGNDCATGVVFTRNPSDGKNEIYGEYLINAQGEDVVAGTRTPQYITKKAKQKAGSKDLSMEEAMPKVFKELEKVFLKLEKHYKDMQDIEFTVRITNFGCYRQDQEKELPEPQ
jgi:pyruvate,orthophosphate dikinase